MLLLAAVAAVSMRAAAPLAVVDATVRQMEDGAPLPPGFIHIPGELVFFSFRVEGYRPTAEQKVQLSYEINVLDPKGVRVMEPITGKVEATLAYEDKNWKPKVHPEIQIPPLAGSGAYRISVQVKDEVANATAAQDVIFNVRGHEVEPSDTLVVRNFHFYRSDQATEPMEDNVYRPGETLWARFDLIGYKYGPGNSIDVTYGISVLAPSGKVLFSQPEAATEKSSNFYPQRYVPNSMNLSLQHDIRPGQYTIVITAHDRIGNQTCESKQGFGIQ